MTELFRNGRPENPGAEWLIDTQVPPDKMWEFVSATGAKEWVGLMRATNPDSSIDIEGTARNLGIPVRYSDSELSFGTRGGTWGLPTGDTGRVSMTLNSVHEYSQPLTYGHEVGHVFLSIILGQAPHEVMTNPSVELFCDYFGYEFVLPTSLVDTVEEVDETVIRRLMVAHNLDVPDVITRLMLGGKLPEKVAIDSKIPKGGIEKYSDKMCRSYLCLRCQQGLACDTRGDSIKVLRFPEENWWGKFGDCKRSEPDYFWDEERLNELNGRYQGSKQ